METKDQDGKLLFKAGDPIADPRALGLAPLRSAPLTPATVGTDVLIDLVVFLHTRRILVFLSSYPLKPLIDPWRSRCSEFEGLHVVQAVLLRFHFSRFRLFAKVMSYVSTSSMLERENSEVHLLHCS